MDEFTTTKLNADTHLILEQPLLRVPVKQARRNFKVAEQSYKSEREHVLRALKEETARAAAAAAAVAAGQAVSDATGAAGAERTLATLDALVERVRRLKRKMEAINAEDVALQRRSRRRLEHLSELHRIPSLADVKYDEWSKVRLNRLLVDYLLRKGYAESARMLAEEKGIEDLVDLDVFVQCHRIEESLRTRKSVKEALEWCREHKALMKAGDGALEFELRLQEYIELRRQNKVVEARKHAQKYLAPKMDTYPAEVNMAAGLLAHPQKTTIERYKAMYSPARWTKLAALFTKTHHDLYALPNRPLLHIALSAGLSALKTPACHSAVTSSSSNASSSATAVCPICSKELNELARDLPYAHHSKSSVEADPVMLPNGRIYGRERLVRMNEKFGLARGRVKDPTTREDFDESEIRKVYVS